MTRGGIRTRPLAGLVAAPLLLAGLVVPAAAAAPAPGDDVALSSPREDPYYPAKGDPGVDALHYGLQLRWSPGQRRLTGVARIRFRAPIAESQVRLDLGRPLHVGRVTLDGQPRTHRHRGNHLLVDTGSLAADSRHTLVVAYHGTPRRVATPTTREDAQTSGWTTTARGEVWTMQEPFGAFTWYPVNDHPSDKALYDVRLSVPRRMVGIFNGRLVHRSTRAGRTVTRWHLASPVASYLTTVAIGDYVSYRDVGPHGLPITYWLPRRDQRALPELRRTPALIRWLEARLGPYPFDRVGAVVVPSPSAMETQTLVTMGAQLMRRPRLFRADLLHEYAHQWYGDTVTPNGWTDLWLNESFATHIQLQWEIDKGRLTSRDVEDFLVSEDNAMRRRDGPPGAFDKGEFGMDCVYYCGALMLDRLRRDIGADQFDSALRDWPQEHRYANVDREVYIAWLSGRVGRDVGPFIRTWLTSPTTPG